MPAITTALKPKLSCCLLIVPRWISTSLLPGEVPDPPLRANQSPIAVPVPSSATISVSGVSTDVASTSWPIPTVVTHKAPGQRGRPLSSQAPSSPGAIPTLPKLSAKRALAATTRRPGRAGGLARPEGTGASTCADSWLQRTQARARCEPWLHRSQADGRGVNCFWSSQGRRTP